MGRKKNRDLEPGDRVNVVMVVQEIHKTPQGTTIVFEDGFRMYQATNVEVDMATAIKTPNDPLQPVALPHPPAVL